MVLTSPPNNGSSAQRRQGVAGSYLRLTSACNAPRVVTRNRSSPWRMSLDSMPSVARPVVRFVVSCSLRCYLCVIRAARVARQWASVPACTLRPVVPCFFCVSKGALCPRSCRSLPLECVPAISKFVPAPESSTSPRILGPSSPGRSKGT